MGKQGTLIARELLKTGFWKCPGCKTTKELATGFYKNKASRTGYASHCIVCMNKNEKFYRNKEKRSKAYATYKHIHRNKILLSRFGITLDTYNQMLERQNSVCMICGKTDTGKSLAVDHNHMTGQVRDLLCSRCNAGIGFIKEDITIAEKMIDYLRRHNGLSLDK